MEVTGTAAYGVYARDAALPDIVHTLNLAGFAKESICMVLSPAHPVAEDVCDAKIVDAANESIAKSARTIGWFSEFGAVVIPSIGLFIRSDAFLKALVAGHTLAGLGFQDDDAKRVNRQLADIGALIYVSCPEKSKAESATKLLKNAGAREAASMEGVKVLRTSASG